MNATKWYRRSTAQPYYNGRVTAVRFGSKPEEIHLNLTAFAGDDVDRLKVQLSLEEARSLRDSLTALLDIRTERGR